MLTFDVQQKLINKLLKKQENVYCSDCNTKSPCWASLDFGVFICMNCSGAHRALGPSITRVKSIKLDAWHKDWLNNMMIGNSKINEYWQANIIGYKKPTNTSSIDQLKKYAVQKYVKKRFAKQDSVDPLTAFKNNINSNPNPIQPPQVKEKKSVSVAKPIVSKDVFSFDPFSKITKPKKIQALIDFDQPKIKQVKNVQQKIGDFNFFDEPKQSEHKYNKNNFNSFSGYKATNSTTGHCNFDEFLGIGSKPSNDYFNFDVKNKSDKKSEKKIDPISAYGNQPMTFNTQNLNQNMGQYYGTSYNTSINNYNTMNFNTTSQNLNQTNNSYGFNVPSHVTMNINMNMYPNVMNINIANNSTQVPKPSDLNVKKPITLQLNNITLNQQKKDSSKQGKSWVDQWK